MTEMPGPPPTPTAGERLAEIARAVVADVPIPGTESILEIWAQVFGTAYRNRRDAWEHTMYEVVVDLNARQIDIESLCEQPAFVSAVHEASRIAIGEHLEDKLQMLKAVLVNAGVRPTDRVADIATLRYLRWISEFEPEHVLVLRTASNDLPQPRSSRQDMLTELRSLPKDDAQMLVDDLQQRGLVKGRLSADQVVRSMRSEEFFDRGRTAEPAMKARLGSVQLTRRGREFLDWITIV